MGAHAAPRLPRFSYRGPYAYAITCCTWKRRPRFTSAAVVVQCRDGLFRAATAEQSAVSAYCFMPDHVHVLLETQQNDSDARRLISDWKQRTGYAFARDTGQRLWQFGYYDRVLRQDEPLAAAVTYLLANPLRAGLVVDLQEYPFWGSQRWSRAQLADAVSSRYHRAG